MRHFQTWIKHMHHHSFNNRHTLVPDICWNVLNIFMRKYSPCKLTVTLQKYYLLIIRSIYIDWIERKPTNWNSFRLSCPISGHVPSSSTQNSPGIAKNPLHAPVIWIAVFHVILASPCSSQLFFVIWKNKLKEYFLLKISCNTSTNPSSPPVRLKSGSKTECALQISITSNSFLKDTGLLAPLKLLLPHSFICVRNWIPGRPNVYVSAEQSIMSCCTRWRLHLPYSWPLLALRMCHFPHGPEIIGIFILLTNIAWSLNCI